ncbi:MULTISPECIES: thiolase family protein [Sphingobium]|uniref:Thiolase family protein n=1 Tax=Sphingobium tyrosinilyticum TaxID=2715436 RepID=A0ABV9EWJ5_9SPHN|nr:thiolase family protein [Sphingobium sp. EP60837]ANI76784.1 Acetyl-CoA C-acetyltransferase [Sphingobium sp. EP60837]
MWAHRNKVAVAGVGYSKLERRSGRTLAALTLEACDAALADAGLLRSDLDGIATSPSMPRYGGRKGVDEGIDIVTPWYLADLLGAAGRVQWIGSTNGMVTQSLIDSALAIIAGLCDHVLVYRSLHVPEGRYVNFDTAHAVGTDQYLAPYGFSMPPAWAAVVLRRYFELHGYDRRDFAHYIAANRANAQRNPHAYWRGKSLSEADYIDARMIADPLSILDCDIPVDGCCALILTSAERARHLRQPPALLTGFAASAYQGASGTPMNLEDMWSGARALGRRLWDMTGLTPADVDTAQLYDGFSVLVLTWLEGMGFCRDGEGLGLLRDGYGDLDGKLPINTGGGALGEGRLHGMTQLAEAVAQVTDRAGVRQVPGGACALATISNGLAKSTAFLFSRDS